MAITERVNITVTSTGTVRVKKELADVGREARNSANGVDMLRNALGGLISAATVASLVKYGDTFLNIQNRLRLVDAATESVTKKTQQLYDVAQRSRTGYEAVVSLYQRSADTVKQLGKSSEDGVKFVELLSKAATASGTGAQLATAGIEQFSQALSNGRLNGDELVSVMTNIPYVAKLIAESLKVPVGTLKSLGEQGKLTSDILIKALLGSADKINKTFATQMPTISQGLTVINNAFIRLAGLLETNTGLFGLIGMGLVAIGNNLEIVMIALSPVLIGLTTLGVTILAGYVAQGLVLATTGVTVLGTALLTFSTTVLVPAIAALTSFVVMITTAAASLAVTLVTALVTATGAVLAFTVALLTNPFTWIIIGVGLTIAALLKLTGQFDSFVEYISGWSTTVGDYVSALIDYFGPVGDFIREWATSIYDYVMKIVDAIKAVMGALDSATGKASTMSKGAGSAGASGGGSAGALGGAGKEIKKSIVDGGKTAAEIIAERQAKADAAGAAMLEKSYGKFDFGGDIEKGGKAAGGSMGDAIRDAGKDAATSISKVSIGGKSSGMSGRISMEDFGKVKTVGMTSYAGSAANSNNAQGSDPSSPYTPGFATGGSMRVGGSGGTDSQMVQFRATPNEHVTVETPSQRRANNQSSPVVVPAPIVNINNHLDPRGSIDAMKTKAGQNATTNNIRANKEQIRRILGSK